MPLGFGEPFGVAAIAFRHTVSIPSDKEVGYPPGSAIPLKP